MTREEFLERYKRFEDRWRLEPSSYQIRNKDGSPGGWVAQVHVWEDRGDSSTVRPLLQRELKIYDTPDQANYVALRMGLRWLEENA